MAMLEHRVKQEMVNEWSRAGYESKQSRVIARQSPVPGSMPRRILNGNGLAAAAPQPNPAQANQDVIPGNADDVEALAAPFIQQQADVRVLAQTVVISELSLSDESFKVFTELSVVPLVSDLSKIQLHLGSCALLPNESGGDGGRVTINDIDVRYSRVNTLPNAMASVSNPAMGELGQKVYSALKENNYNIELEIPRELYPEVIELRCLKVGLDVLVRKARNGVQFNCPFARDGTMEKGAHLFTFRSSPLSSTSEWLPCVDTPDQLCLWRILITCDVSFTAIASAELLDVQLSNDLREKTYHFQQIVPTSPPNIGWAIGQFNVIVHPELPEVTSFALPGLNALVKHTVGAIDKVLEYFEELLSCRFPYPSYKQVFVDKAGTDLTSYSSLSIYSVNLLYHKKVIDVVQSSRQVMALSVAEQFFGNFISPSHYIDMWITKSLSRFVTSMFVRKVFGNSEYLSQMLQSLNAVCDYETQWGKLILHPRLSAPMRANLHCDARNDRTCSPLYVEMLHTKGHLVNRMLHSRLGHEPFLQVLHKLLLVARQMCEKRDRPVCWTHMLISSDSYFHTVTNVTGREIPTFLEQWVDAGGHACFQITYAFNRKRNMIELEVKQDLDQGNGRLRYLGPLTVVVQELDGSFTHTVQIDGDISRSDLQCHSKGRRQKKKRVPLYTGEEVEIDLTSMDPDSPVLWIRADPEFVLLRTMLLRQPNYQWEYMLKYEKDVLAQFQALERLQQFPSAQSRIVLTETVTNDVLFYKVRIRAAHALTAVLNKMTESWTGIPVLVSIFREWFGSKSSAMIPRSNNFVLTTHNLQLYFIMQALPQAVAKMRATSGLLLTDVQQFVMDLLRFNDNSSNRYSDDHYRASLLQALASTILPASTLGGSLTPDSMSFEMKAVLKEFSLALNMDTLKPSYGRVVGIAALQGIYELQKNSHIPSDSHIFWQFVTNRICQQMRLAAISILVDRISSQRDRMACDDLLRLLQMATVDTDSTVCMHIARELATTPPFSTTNNSDFGATNACNVQQVADALWNYINDLTICTRVRLLFADVYFSLYGLAVPPVKGGPSNAPGHHRAFASNTAVSDWNESTLENDEAAAGPSLNDTPQQFVDDMALQ